jgi:2-succinyl-5-enolpyruvyl-6-hydroxy-3-cyclohexene-1-carboxylate synthase
MLPDDSGLFLANSMPVRDADGCGIRSRRPIHVGTNRGASGIDGIIATSAGFADGLRKRVVLMTGDLGFLHDINSLLLVRNSPAAITVVLLNNNGGGLFSFLPIAEHERHFEEFFGAPHRLNFGYAASLFELDYFCPETVSQLRECAVKAFGTGRSSIIEIRTDRRQNYTQHRQIWSSVAEAIRKEFA